jgi:hypothetical protein
LLKKLIVVKLWHSILHGFERMKALVSNSTISLPMEEPKSQQRGGTASEDIYRSMSVLHPQFKILTVSDESSFSKYIPGGYSPSRCLKLSGKPMMYAILSLAGCAIMFFGYDASVMSLVNTNIDYLHLMGAASGSKRDSAAIGGLVSLWFGGFAMGMGHWPRCLSI